ncbi:ceramidase, partial [Paraphysoderma sedebokerense]
SILTSTSGHLFSPNLVNTTSNIIFIYLSVLGFLACKKYNYPLRFYLSFLSVGVVGMGSALFHGSLTYWTQLLDEVPMIWGSGVFLYSCFQIQKHKSYGHWLTVLLVGYCVWVTVTYLLNRDDDFFQTAYGILANTLSSKTTFTSNESSPKKSGTPTIRNQILTPALCLLLTSFFSYGTGFVFWILDNVFCHSHLIPYKQSLGNISWLLEFHAFWHIGTGWGTYCCI